MTIRQISRYEVMCDYCGKNVSMEVKVLKTVLDASKTLGWIFIDKKAGEYYSFCSQHCKDSYFEENNDAC
ncbi:MAG: hypothetical protein ACOC5T_00535 [Elusimicrobiota bacterium]